MSGEKHGRGVESGWQMLDAFASLGMAHFDLTRTDMDGRKQAFAAAQSWQELRDRMPALLESARQRQHNVIVRPRGSAGLVQLDDLDGAAVERVRSAAFLILTTSVGNHQAWVAIRECTPEVAGRLRRGTGADPSASGAARVAGSSNFKRKYAPDFPTVHILEVRPRHMVTAAALEALGVLAPQDRIGVSCPRRVSSYWARKAWPSYQRCVQNAPLRRGEDLPDISRADFTFCLLAIDWGWSIEATAARLLESSSKARENGPAYARLTAERAAAAVYRRNLHLTSIDGTNKRR
jgi:hypothetical protein